DEPVQSRLRLERLVLFLLLFFARRLFLQVPFLFLLLAREGTQHLVSGENLEDDRLLLLRPFLPPVVDHGSAGQLLAPSLERVLVVLADSLDLDPDRRAWREETHGVVGERLVPLLKRREVVEDPERSSLRRGDQVVVLDREVGDRDDREVALKSFPMGAAVEGDVEAR